MDVRGFVPAGTFDSRAVAISSHNQMYLNYALATSSPASAAYPAANLALYVPFFVTHPAVVREVYVATGTLTTSNATEIGVYDTAGNRLFSQATTVATASDVVNSSGMTDFVLDVGSYYMAFACDGTRNFLATAHSIAYYQAMGCMQQTGLSGATLPSTATFAIFEQAYLPIFGLNTSPANL